MGATKHRNCPRQTQKCRKYRNLGPQSSGNAQIPGIRSGQAPKVPNPSQKKVFGFVWFGSSEPRKCPLRLVWAHRAKTVPGFQKSGLGRPQKCPVKAKKCPNPFGFGPQSQETVQISGILGVLAPKLPDPGQKMSGFIGSGAADPRKCPDSRNLGQPGPKNAQSGPKKSPDSLGSEPKDRKNVPEFGPLSL